MTKSLAEEQFAAGAIDQDALFEALFSTAALKERFEDDFSRSAGKGTDRLNGFQFAALASTECDVASAKCLAGTYRFAPYLENLKPKGRNKAPRLIGIPTLRDRVVLGQLNRFFAAVFPDCVPKNIASAYVRSVFEDLKTKTPSVTWICRDDVLMYGDKDPVERALRSLRARLRRRGLSLHPEASGKTSRQPMTKTFGYLGYTFTWPQVSVREVTVERFLQSIAAKFSEYVHNKSRRLERFKYLTEARVGEIFLLELNERITGAISEKRRYGWIAYFNQITDLSLLHRLDRAIARMFGRLPDFGRKAPEGLRSLSRAYFEMKFNPNGGYVRDYDKIVTRAEKLTFLQERGRVDPAEALTDEQINDRYSKYVHHVLAAMHADESVLYA